MKLLLIHAEKFSWEAKQPSKYAEEIQSQRNQLQNVLVAFTAIEKDDDLECVEQAAAEIKSHLSQLGINQALIYPYAHLSSNLASPSRALDLLDELQSKLMHLGIQAQRAPFGWYKAFNLECKGHPLAELSRSIQPSRHESKAIAAEFQVKSEWFILDSSKLIPAQEFDFSKHPNLKLFLDYERQKKRSVDKPPVHLELMRRLEIADHEPASDPGNLRYYPKGRLIKSLLEDLVTLRALEHGAMEVETPCMYDLNHPTMKQYLDRFPARQYTLRSGDREFFLRFAACFGQFMLAKDLTISHRHLPLRFFELARYSYRREQHGELAGLRRLRAFTMPDMHTLCKDMDQALQEFRSQLRLCISVLEEIGLESQDYELGIRFTRDFYAEHSDFIHGLSDVLAKPALVEIWDSPFFYFVLKCELNFIDSQGKPTALSTVQLDLENSKRYGIKYVDPHDKFQYPIILHCSPSGAIERCIYALLEKSWIHRDRNPPMLPVWLSPVQVRIIPISQEYLDPALEIASKLKARVEVDDRAESLNRKIRDAGRDWIPYVVVIGAKEIESGLLSVTLRARNEKLKLSLDQLNSMIQEELRSKPWRPIPGSILMSSKPRFHAE